MSIFNLFSSKRGSNANIKVPKLNYQETLKRYINTLDKLNNENKDFQQITVTVLSTLDKKANEKLPKLDFGSTHDAYALVNHMGAVLNTIQLQIKTSIQQEFSTRTEMLEQDNLYHELTTLTLTDDQLASLLAFEQIHKDDYISRATTSREESIVTGNKSSKRIIESEHANQDSILQKEADRLELAKTKNSNFKDVSYNLTKAHYQRKANAHHKLSPIYFDDLQKGLTSSKNIKNGEAVNESVEDKMFP